MTMSNEKELAQEQREQLLEVLKARFEKDMDWHEDLEWEKVQTKLAANPDKLWSLHEMESTGGEPDVVEYIQRQTSTSSMIAHRKVLKAAEVFVTTGKR